MTRAHLPPLIGITAYSEMARWGVWEQQATLLPQNYVDQVGAAGGIPVLLPPVSGVEAAVGRLDGLVISGGPDVEPGRYGQEPAPQTTVVRPGRDEAEMSLFRAALENGTPVLGICRGMQLMNVELGGTLIQHLPGVVGHDGHSPTPGAMGRHTVRVGQSSCLAAIVGTGPAVVPTHHHQGIDKLGRGLVATAWADDGTIEAFELEPAEHRFAVGVQWHPEAGSEQALFRALIETARGLSRHRPPVDAVHPARTDTRSRSGPVAVTLAYRLASEVSTRPPMTPGSPHAGAD